MGEGERAARVLASADSLPPPTNPNLAQSDCRAEEASVSLARLSSLS